MKKLMSGTVLVVIAVGLMLASAASAHNRGLVMLPNGECVQVGSLKSMVLPDGTFLDLRPETTPDEIGTALAADEGNSALEKGNCP